MDGVYEQAIHARDAIPAGVAQATVDAALAKSDMTTATPDEALAVQLTRELMRTRAVTDETFAAARQRFGDSAMVDLVATASYYGMLAFLHNALLIGR